MKPSLRACALLSCALLPMAAAAIPATPVMTLYKFNGPLEIPYYSIGPDGPGPRAGSLLQGTSVIPCLVVRDGRPLTDANGTPFVGFEIVVDPAKAKGEADTRAFRQAFAERSRKQVQNHHCAPDVRHVLNVRDLYVLEKAPLFDPPGRGDPEAALRAADGTLDGLVRAFHNSPECAAVNERLTGRRERLASAWDSFVARQRGRFDERDLTRAKHLDYTLRTAIFEGHLERGCSAYGACERNAIALSIRNRAVGQCLARQGCRFPGDFQGVSSDVAQYNIWDAYLTQISGLTACFLRTDLAGREPYDRWQAMYAQNVGDVARILFGNEADLRATFPDTPVADLLAMRHYYHPPAMGKCFPQESRVEYISGAVAQKGKDFALLANARIKVGDKVGSGYAFREFRFDAGDRADVIRIEDHYPGFVIDGRKVSLKGGGGCTAYGVSPGCKFGNVGRWRKTPSWLAAGKPLALHCRVQDRGQACTGGGRDAKVAVGGACDVDMMPVSGVH